MVAWHLFTIGFALLATSASAQSTSSGTIVPTKNYIDTITGYIDLSTCAEGVLSTIVRAQQSGCGDHMALTSYTCFCTNSSSYFSRMISTEVVSSCGSAGSEQASSAIAVWDGYCALGVEAGLSTTSAGAASATGTATPAAGATGGSATRTGGASTFITSTTGASAASSSSSSTAASSSDSSSNSSNDSSSRTTAIAAGVAVPVGVIGLALVGYLFYRKHVNARAGPQQQQQLPPTSPTTEMDAPVPPEKRFPVPQELTPNGLQELPYDTRDVHELDGNVMHEAEADAWKRP